MPYLDLWIGEPRPDEIWNPYSELWVYTNMPGKSP